MRRQRLGCHKRRRERRSGMVRRPAAPDSTARPANVEGMRAKPQERRPDRSVRRREGDGRPIDRAGDQGPPAVATRHRDAAPPGGGRHRVNAVTGEGRPSSTLPKERKTRRSRHPRAGPRGGISWSRASRYARTVRKAIFSERRAKHLALETQGLRAGRSTRDSRDSLKRTAVGARNLIRPCSLTGGR
jgi:hypothetical protein